jgi:hypothetical protein
MARLDAEPEQAAAEVRRLPRAARSPGKVVALVAASLALAAGAAFFLRSSGPAPTELASKNPTPSVATPQSAAEEAEPVAVASADATDSVVAERSAASIEIVDFGSSAGTIFLAGEEDGEETTPVVWVMDEPGQSPGRMEPL